MVPAPRITGPMSEHSAGDAAVQNREKEIARQKTFFNSIVTSTLQKNPGNYMLHIYNLPGDPVIMLR
jgi:hypothetical protein